VILYIQVSAEVTFTAAVTWVNHNNDEREKLFSKLFSFVNPTSLSRYFFNKVVRSEVCFFVSYRSLNSKYLALWAGYATTASFSP